MLAHTLAGMVHSHKAISPTTLGARGSTARMAPTIHSVLEHYRGKGDIRAHSRGKIPAIGYALRHWRNRCQRFLRGKIGSSFARTQDNPQQAQKEPGAIKLIARDQGA